MQTSESRADGLTPKGRATRERIVAAAARLIAERGVAGTTTEEVRDSAGVSSSQLYHYFDSKAALVRAVIEYQTDAILEAQGYLKDLDSLEGLRRWRNMLVGIQRSLRCQYGCPLGSLSTEIAEISTEYRLDLNRAFARWEDGIRNGLRSMYKRRELRSDANPDRLATALLAAVQGGLLLTQLRRSTKPLEAAIDTVLDHIASFATQPVRSVRMRK